MSSDASLVQTIFRRESRSFLQYIHDASPWASEADAELRSTLLTMAEAERNILARLAEQLTIDRIALPHLGAFPMAFTSFNFVAVRSLLPPLRREMRDSVERLANETANVHSAALRSLLAEWCQWKREQIHRLDQWSAQIPTSTSTRDATH